jgi:endonuclease/exonuclease/phosphatase family metal-dependent hydrolase
VKKPIQLEEALIAPEKLLRIATINILHTPKLVKERVKALVEELEFKDIDVLCLQEVLSDRSYGILETLEDELGYTLSHVASSFDDTTGFPQGNAILVKSEKATFKELDMTIDEVADKFIFSPAVIAEFTYNHYQVNVINAHLKWGSENEWIRLRQAERISKYAAYVKEKNPEAIILFAGDFNAVEETSTLRFLYGLQEGIKMRGTLWVDAWKMHGTEENYVTSDTTRFWGKETNKRFTSTGINSLTPKRRIDYILSHEWAYGRPGSPMTFNRFGDRKRRDKLEISDHYGLYSDIYVP